MTRKKIYSTAFFFYKCRRCGKLKSNIECSMSIALPELTCALRGVSRVEGQLSVPLTDVHVCDDGGAGVADLQGYNVE